MTDLRIEREIVVDAPIDVVWRTITEPAQIVLWFADRVDLKAEPGAAGALTFEPDGGTVVAPVIVEAVEPPTRFTFRWSHPEGATPDERNSLLVEMTLVAEAEERTRLRVVETGLETVEWSQAEKARYADDHNGGWEHHLGRLRNLYAGSGSPA